MAAADEIALQPGYAFRPSDDHLITLFLRPKISKVPFEFEDWLINHADVYSADPAELVAEHRPAPGTQGSSSVWYFFCSPRYTSKRRTSGRRRRAIGGGCTGGESVWKSEGGKKAVIGADGRRVGYLQKFSYGVYESSSSSGSARTFTRLGWCMTEYGLDDAIDGADQQVLCKVYRSPRAVCAEARTAAKSADSSCSGSKRKADDVVNHLEEAPPSARPRQEVRSEHDGQPELLPELDLDALLSAPTDDKLGVEFDTATTEQYMRYLMNDEPLPWAPTMEVVDDGGRGDGDEFIKTANGPCIEEEIIERLAAGQTLDEILGTDHGEQVFD
uniref:NAC domain-containing protein n=1 Tax=Oryza punctata TaxID=4537 RepID=A0A0E0KL06_ORYPU